MKIKDKTSKLIFDYLIATLCVYGNGSLLYVDHNQLFNFFLVAAFAILVLLESKNNSLRKPNCLTFFLIVLPMVSTLFKYSPLSNLTSLASITILTLLMSLLSLDRILQILNKMADIIFILVVASIVFSTLFYLVPAMKGLPVTDTESGKYYNLLIYTHRYWENFRIQGIYWEPGTWAVNQAFGCFWFMFYKKRYQLYPIFLLSFILTMSTTGFILLLIITAAFAYESVRPLKIHRRIRYCAYPIGLLLAVLIILVVRFNIDVNDYAFKNTFGKFVAGSETYGSHEERLNTTKNALEIANNNILLGNGKTAHLYVTSTIFDVLYQFGYPYTILYMICCWQVFRRVGFVFSVPFMLALLNGEVLSYFSLFTLLIMLGSKMMFVRNKPAFFAEAVGTFSATSPEIVPVGLAGSSTAPRFS